MNLTPFAGAAPPEDALLAASPLVELANTLQTIKDNLLRGDPETPYYRDTFQDFTKVFPLIVRMATNNPPADIANVLQFLEGTSSGDGIAQLLEVWIQQYSAELDEFDDGAPEKTEGHQFLARTQAQLEWWNRLGEYLKKMIEVSEAPLKTRKLTSDALIKSLGFGKLQRNISTTYKVGVVPEETFIDTTGNVNNPQNAQRAVDAAARAGRSGAFINPSNVFTPRAPRREDSQHGFVGDGGATFSRSAQNAYAYGSGEYQDNTGGRPRAWAGEEALAEYATAPGAEALAGLAEQEEGADLQRLSARAAASAAPRVSSRFDPVTQGYNIAPDFAAMSRSEALDYEALEAERRGEPEEARELRRQARAAREGTEEEEEEEEEAPAAAASSSASDPPPIGKQFTRADIPRTIEELRLFIEATRKRFPEFKQAIYRGSKARSVRTNTINKLESLGLL
jgi:hypothetical protein